MSADGPELLALALSLASEGAGDDDAIVTLVDAAQGSATSLMAACTYALSLARDMPYDAANERTLDLLTRSTQQAVRMTENAPSGDQATLLTQIVEISGPAAVDPRAVASRTAELDADLDKLRPSGESEASAVS